MPNLLSTPHGDKLNALLKNRKLPEQDKERVEQAIQRYQEWLDDMHAVTGDMVNELVTLFNRYKRFVDLDLIFDTPNDFLYRQKGQLKLDNTIIEEFLPILLTRSLGEENIEGDLLFGSMTCFSGIRFESGMTQNTVGAGMKLRQKDHDFAIGRKLFLRSSHQQDFSESITAETHLAYVAAECKTNLDKTMFQEASATALDVKLAVPNARYFLLCEWLDMTPISTSSTAIDEIIILRRAKRLSSTIRSNFSSYEGRMQSRAKFVEHLDGNPFTTETFTRFIGHVHKLIDHSTEDVLSRGYF